MKKVIIGLLVLMFVGADLFGQTYNIDEVVTPPTNEKEVIITYFKSSMEPVNGIVYCKYGNKVLCCSCDKRMVDIFREGADFKPNDNYDENNDGVDGLYSAE